MALASVAKKLGWTRLGIVYTRNAYGNDLRVEFINACRALGVTVAANVGMDWTRGLSPARKNFAISEFSRDVESRFTQRNVHVYLFALDPSDLGDALGALRSIDMIGSGYTLLLPSAVVMLAETAQLLPPRVQQDLRALSGSIGVCSPGGDNLSSLMWSAWPTTADNWTALLGTSPQTSTLTTLVHPGPTRRNMTVWAKYVWDGTMLLGKSIASAWRTCSSPTSSDGRPNSPCLLAHIRNMSHVGTTGRIVLDDTGDRQLDLGVFNFVNGESRQLGMCNRDGYVTIRLRSVVWSDGVSNRTTAPLWGQMESTTEMNHAALPSQSESTSIAILLGTLLLVLFSLFVLLRLKSKRHHSAQPADFRKVEPRAFLVIVICALNSHPGPLQVIQRLQPSSILNRTVDPNAQEEQKSSKPSIVQLACDGKYGLPQELKRRHVSVEEQIGKGQFGEVFRGTLEVHSTRFKQDIPVAIKTVRSDRESQAAFLDEAAITWQFNHKNVVGMYGVVTSGAPLMLVLEYCDVGELHAFVRAPGPDLSTGLLLRILGDIACGMRYLVSKHFVHRDLAARNVLLNHDLQGKICDFGLGRAIGRENYYR